MDGHDYYTIRFQIIVFVTIRRYNPVTGSRRYGSGPTKHSSTIIILLVYTASTMLVATVHSPHTTRLLGEKKTNAFFLLARRQRVDVRLIKQE